jgi:hypothetical protein
MYINNGELNNGLYFTAFGHEDWENNKIFGNLCKHTMDVLLLMYTAFAYNIS